jgi:energy-coupling factor transporter ATP-binding protein EcfA2
MTDLFLRRVELSNFRLYGDSYIFDFDTEPGVTLVVGANGLGKTTLFDGMEWALTGDVSRFSDFPGDGRRRERDPLTRLGQPEGSHRVGLQFNEGAPIDRGQGREPSEVQIASLLRQPGWAEIGDLHRYLSITHFLGQAASMRFSVRKPKEQWEALKGPAGVDRINYAKERLGGQAARQAFTRVVREASNRLVELNANLAAWHQLLAERERLAQLSVSEDAISPDELAAVANDLARRLVELTPGVRWNEAAGEAPEALLSRLAALSAAAEDRARAEQVRLRVQDAHATEFANVVAEATAQTDLVSQTERRQLETATALRAAEVALADSEATVAAGQRRVSEARAQVGALVRAAAAAAQLAAAEAALAATDAALSESDAAAEDAARRQEEFGQHIAGVTARIEQRRRITEQLADARTRVDLTERWLVVRVEIGRLAELAARTDAGALRAQRGALLAQQASASDEISHLGAELRRLDERTSAIAEAVATISSRLTEGDTHCPVCDTEFVAGELLRVARMRPGGRASSAFELADRLAACELRRAKAAEALRALDSTLGQHIQTLADLTQQRAAEQTLLQQLAEAGASPASKPDRDGAAAAVAEFEAALRSIESTIEAQPSLDVLRAERQGVIASLEAETARRAELVRRRAEHLATAETSRAILRQSPEVWSAEQGVTADLEQARAAASARADAAAGELRPLQEALDAHRQSLEALRQRSATDEAARQAANVRLNQAGRRRQELIEAWQAAGLSGDPDSGRLATQIALAGDRLAVIVRLRERQKRLSAGYRRWTGDEALRDVQRRIDQRVASRAGAEAVTAELAQAVNEAQSRLERAERARARMESVVSTMQSTADDYAENVLQPLNETIRRFSRALMTQSDAAIVYEAEHFATRAELRPRAVRTERDGSTAVLDINPNRYFSEGQLSALSVSALLAASTSFRWSRWRGLLMDDPLQHNDVIHASAFMDLMRQLVRRLDYQVIMSTHDSAEAAFLIRKCESAGIPLRVHEMQPPGDDGLVSAAA